MDLSVVVPIYNEEESLEALIQETNEVLRALGKDCEIIIVDDGSTDGTYPILIRLYRQEPRLRVVRLKRNFGQTAAVAAGLAYAQGEVIVAMDGDGQNDPRDIPALLAKLDEGFDLVSGWRSPRQDPFWTRRLPSQIANGLISWITEVKLHDYGCTLKAIRREIAKDLKLYGEMHRFIPAIAYERGARIAEIKVHHRPRLWGKSKYGIARTFRVVLDLLTVKFLLSYATRPLHIFGPVGLLSGAVGFVLAVYLTVQKLVYGLEIAGRPLLLLSVLLILVSFQFITMGLLAEMLARTYHESQNKPIYVIKEVLDERRRA
ncbi:MAG: glycosyl transferase [Deltaproteobacteria bacterium RIFCSPLOWO2_12_FULL_57_22]|nr:MAG: glycosyl transferase [Deltaproteobacteria bacterium RIFCSPLOWO2_12_FULL_57_22]